MQSSTNQGGEVHAEWVGICHEEERIAALEELLSRPSREVVQALGSLDGDLMVLGAGGKMGPTLTLLARRAIVAGNLDKRVIAVSRFSHPETATRLERAGVEVISCDLTDEDAVTALPEASNVVYMVGTKFGSTGQENRTWAINAFLPGVIMPRFRHSKMVVFSSGNVYPFAPVVLGGSIERDPPSPVGEYAQSVLGRERIVSHFCARYGVPGVLFRLNYAVEMRYGVLLDVARRVWAGDPVDLSTGHVNVIWQGDANTYALRALTLAQDPLRVLNATGPETIPVRKLAERFGELLDRTPVLTGEESSDALLSDAGEIHKLLGYPRVPVGLVIEWVAEWVMSGGPVLGKPTKYQVRDGRF